MLSYTYSLILLVVNSLMPSSATPLGAGTLFGWTRSYKIISFHGRGTRVMFSFTESFEEVGGSNKSYRGESNGSFIIQIKNWLFRSEAAFPPKASKFI